MTFPSSPGLLAIGDSWQYVGLTKSLGTELAALRCNVIAHDSPALCENGKTLRKSATEDLSELVTVIANLDGSQSSPRAILMSGGGNDLASRNSRDHRASRLFSLLNPGARSVNEALHAERVQAFIHGELRNH